MSGVMGVKVVTKKSIPAREPKGDVSIHINKKVGRFTYTFSVQRHKGMVMKMDYLKWVYGKKGLWTLKLWDGSHGAK